MTFCFLPPAEAELLEAISYYSTIRPDLGASFERAVAEAVRSAVDHPERGAPRSKFTRRWLVKGFPFGVIYRASGADVLVIAVAHGRKMPEYWTGRIA